jgi:predicted alpha/beta-fold hydrolase
MMDRSDSFHGSTTQQNADVQQMRPRLGKAGVHLMPPDDLPGIPRFQPARGLWGAHLQTVWGTLFPGRVKLTGTTERRLRLDDGDFVVMHDNCPGTWQRGDHAVMLMHGLCGSHQSGYMVRLTNRLMSQGIRVFRLDHRGCGAGALLARNPYHAGRTEDVAAAVQMVERLCPGSPISLAGFSISGNLLLRYLGENPEQLPLSLFRAVAICPPIDLHRCASKLNSSSMGQRYDWYFTRLLISQIANSPLWKDHLPLASVRRPPRRLYDFDELYTAPASGFDSADDYYTQASAIRVINKIRVHTTILAAEDDPVVCSQPFMDLVLPTNVSLCLTRHGGHLGFIGRSGVDPDRRWMDWRLIDWLLT